jgi:ketosteroid isomerase-like protein
VTSPAADPTDDARARNEATVRAVVDCVSSGRFDDILGHVTDDFAFELPYGPKGFGGPFDKTSFDVMQRATFALFSSFRLELTELHPGLDPDDLVAEYRSEATVKANGRDYRNRYVGIFRLRDGRIASWKEFHDQKKADEALGP